MAFVGCLEDLGLADNHGIEAGGHTKDMADGRIAVSEVGARPPGAQITSLLSYAHDIDFYKAWPRILVDRHFDPPPRRYAAGAVYFRGQGRGTVKAIHGLDEAQRRFGSQHFMQQGNNDPQAGAAHRVPQGDSPAIHVDDIGVEPSFLNHSQCLSSKSFV